ncbi:hypothetical protein IQ276_008550 [Desmonostoc muscorum LEGE 12446]|uniref:NACHT C-terminal Cysteine and Histidine-containing domain-containing protein n=1 Tax=Desmonostoc muscorum LEGE 12446 TaxID=1828758 RepID=A0A8J7D1C9_DESMC|nr:hypothetical protein [Desmonostoc muscorum]MCF2146498.1 hypothetical protein [Desmonostoc muscorum LEGE 12446]
MTRRGKGLGIGDWGLGRRNKGVLSFVQKSNMSPIGNTEAIDALTKLINDTLVTEIFLYEDLRNEAAFLLGNIGCDNQVAIDFLKQQYLNNSLCESIRLQAASFLSKINLCNQDVIKFFTDFIKQNNGIYCFTAACSLQFINPSDTVAIDTLNYFLNISKSDELLNIPLLAACLLIDNNPNHTEAIRVLRGFLYPNHHKSDRLQAASCLGKVQEFKQEAVDALYDLLDELTDDEQLQTAQDRYFAQEVCCKLHQIQVITLEPSQNLYQENTFSKFSQDSKLKGFTDLKNMFVFFNKYSNKDEFKEINSVILWHYAQSLSYQDFYYAIHIESNEVLKKFNL